MSRIRAMVSTLKSERALKMKLPTEIRALFSLKGSVAFLRMNSIRQGFLRKMKLNYKALRGEHAEGGLGSMLDDGPSTLPNPRRNLHQRRCHLGICI